MGRKEIVAAFNDRLHRMRRFGHLLNSQAFVDAYRQAKPPDLDKLERVIASGSDLQLRRWIDTINPKDTGPSFEELRTQARRLGIVNYSRMTKAALLSELERARHEEDRIGK